MNVSWIFYHLPEGFAGRLAQKRGTSPSAAPVRNLNGMLFFVGCGRLGAGVGRFVEKCRKRCHGLAFFINVWTSIDWPPFGRGSVWEVSWPMQKMWLQQEPQSFEGRRLGWYMIHIYIWYIWSFAQSTAWRTIVLFCLQLQLLHKDVAWLQGSCFACLSGGWMGGNRASGQPIFQIFLVSLLEGYCDDIYLYIYINIYTYVMRGRTIND